MTRQKRRSTVVLVMGALMVMALPAVFSAQVAPVSRTARTAATTPVPNADSQLATVKPAGETHWPWDSGVAR